MSRQKDSDNYTYKGHWDMSGQNSTEDSQKMGLSAWQRKMALMTFILKGHLCHVIAK